jgi:hypothetical protein
MLRAFGGADMRPWAIVTVVWVGLAAATAAAQGEPPADAPTAAPAPAANPWALELKEKLIYLKFDGAGLAGLHLRQNGKKLELGFFGGNIDPVFSEFPDALESAQRFRAQRIAGSVLYGIGMTVLITELVILFVNAGSFEGQQSVRSNLGWYVAGAAVGGVTGLLGGFLLQASTSSLVEAANRHNFGLLNRQLPKHQQIDPQRFLSLRPTTTLLSLSF